MKTRFFYLLLISILIAQTSCEKEEIEIPFEEKFEQTEVSFLPRITIPEENLKFTQDFFQENLNLKSSKKSELNSLEIYTYYEHKGEWKFIGKQNFKSSKIIEEQFENPITTQYLSRLDIPFAPKTKTRFVFRGFREDCESHYGIVEKDLTIENSDLSVPLIENKSLLVINFTNLTKNKFKKIFEFEYELREIDYEKCAKTIPPINGEQIPLYYYKESGQPIKQKITIENGIIFANGKILDKDFFVLSENYSKFAPEKVSLKIKIYDEEKEIFSETIKEDWINFNSPNLLEFSEIRPNSPSLKISQNGKIIKEFEIGYQSENILTNLEGFFNLKTNSKCSISQKNSSDNGVILFDGEGAIFDGETSFISIDNPLKNIEKNDFTINFFFESFKLNANDGWSVIATLGKDTYSPEEEFINFAIAHKYGQLPGFDFRTTKPTRCTKYRYFESERIEINRKYMVSLIRQNNYLYYYLNGQLITEERLLENNYETGFTTTNFQKIILGCANISNPNFTRWFSGKISKLSLYSKSLTSEEIQYLYNDGRGRYFEEL